MTKERIEQRLRRELTSVNRWAVALKREPRPQQWEAAGDNTPLSEDADVMQAGEEREIRAELLGMLIERAARLDQALQRFREGTYGICTRCERPIHRERLEALPEAAYCLECEEKIESAARTAQPRREEWLEAGKIYKDKGRFG